MDDHYIFFIQSHAVLIISTLHNKLLSLTPNKKPMGSDAQLAANDLCTQSSRSDWIVIKVHQEHVHARLHIFTCKGYDFGQAG